MFRLIITILAFGFLASPSYGKTARQVSAKSKEMQKQVWMAGADTVVKMKGSLSEDQSPCKSFDVKLSDILSFNIDCHGKSKVKTIDLVNKSQYTVTRRNGHTTITKYNYLTKKPQVSNLEQFTLKIPFVEEIIHLKKNEKGELAFYYESFRVDEFGRIVQNQYIQAHSLAVKKLKISAN